MQSALPGALTDSPLAVEIAEPRAEHPVADPGVSEAHRLSTSVLTVPVVSGPASYEITKRGLDLVLGTVGLARTGLVGLVVVPLILKRSDGPAIFKQTRVGKGGKHFTCYKFRTMDLDAGARKAEIAHLNEVDSPAFKMENDPRHVDQLRWLRRFSIDEMPQLWNVLRGEMSLVGPRPPEPQEVASYTPYQLGRLAVTPGLTCTWQVNGRSDISFDEWVAMDLEYIRTRSTLLD